MGIEVPEPLWSLEDRSLERKLLTDLRRKSLRNEGMVTADAKVLALRSVALLQQGWPGGVWQG